MPNAAGIPNCDEDYAKADAAEIVKLANENYQLRAKARADAAEIRRLLARVAELERA